MSKQGDLFGIDRKIGDVKSVTRAILVGGLEDTEAYQVLSIINESKQCGLSNDEIWALIEANKPTRERNLAEEVREWVVSTTGYFLSTDIYKSLDLSTRVNKKNISIILKRLCDDGVIEKHDNRNGSWRKIDRTIVEQCWWEADGEPMEIAFPLGVEKYAKIFPGNVILLEGQKSQGKSAFSIEFCRLNKDLFEEKALYQNIEMSNDELFDRFKSYKTIMPMEEWRESVTFIRQSADWWDKIKPDGLNVVDYLLEYKESYLIADFVWKIHQKLKNGIALIVVQRDPLKPYPTGGRGVRDIPRLVLSLIHHKIKIEDVKSFHMSDNGNPSGMERKYKQVNWWKFIPTSEWVKESYIKNEHISYFDLVKGKDGKLAASGEREPGDESVPF